MEDLQIIRQQAAQAAAELTEKAGLKAGDIFVVGCSSSEIIGGEIGHASSLEAAQAAYEGIQSVLAPKGVFWPPSAASTSTGPLCCRRQR